MDEPNTYAVTMQSVMEVVVLEGGDSLAIAFVGEDERPISVMVPASSAVDLASRIMVADLDAARERLTRRSTSEADLHSALPCAETA
jgi:hypothetical protein